MVGANAAKVAAGLGANVMILDINLDRLRYLDDVMPPNVTTLFSDRHMIREELRLELSKALRPNLTPRQLPDAETPTQTGPDSTTR